MKKSFSILLACSMIASFGLSIGTAQSDATVSIVANAEETNYEYRYCKKNYITSETKLSSPYVLVSENTEYSDYGSWSSWSASSVSSSDTREVQTETRQSPVSYVMVSYRTRGNPNTIDPDCFKTTSNLNVRSEPNSNSTSLGVAQKGNIFIVDAYEGNWVHTPSVHTISNGVVSGWLSKSYLTESGIFNVQYRNYSVNGNYSGYDLSSSWGEHTEGSPWTWDVGTLNSARQVAPWSFVTGLTVNDGSFNADGYNMTDQTGYVLNDGYASYIWFIDKVNYNTETWYRYRDRTQKTIYTYYSLGEWSEWSTTPIDENNDIIVEKREVEKTTTTTTTTTALTTLTTAATTTVTTTASTDTKVNNKIEQKKDDYSFLNLSSYFHSTYQISDSYLTMLNESLSNIEWEDVSDKASGGIKWDGSCYGMSVTQILAKSGLLNPKNIDSNSTCIYDWNAPVKDQNVESIINYYHMLQYSKVFESVANKFTRYTNKKQVDTLIEMASNVEKGGNPVLVCFLFTKTPSNRLGAGHAIVAYGIEYGTWSYGEKYNCRILTSDPNVNGFDDECCIYINTNTYKWEIPHYQSVGYNCTNNNQDKNDNPYARFRLVTNDLNFMDTFGYLRKGQSVSITDVDSTIDINSGSTSFNVAFYDENQSNGISDADCELIYYSGLLDSNASSRTISAILPQVDVPYEYFEKNYTSFDTSMNYPDSTLRAKVSNGINAIYKPNKSVEFNGDNSKYDLYMLMNEGNYTTDWYKIHVNGINASVGTLSVDNAGYIVSSDSFDEGLFINASNREVTARLGVITEFDSVLIYEIDEKTIGVKIDKNGDGIYETKFIPDYLGDVNDDETVSISDAVKLQKHLLNAESFERKQFITGDMNMDGSVDVFDMVLLKEELLKK